MTSKAEYVCIATQTRDHACHWPGCKEQVPPAKWGCAKHWYQLPHDIRTRIWRAFEPGQEITMTPSSAYVAAAIAAQDWIHKTFAPATRREHDPLRWDRLKQYIAERDAARAVRRQLILNLTTEGRSP